jgi:hypothetical protein
MKRALRHEMREDARWGRLARLNGRPRSARRRSGSSTADSGEQVTGNDFKAALGRLATVVEWQKPDVLSTAKFARAILGMFK